MDVHQANRIGTLVHAADLHLGAPLHSLGTVLGETLAEELRQRSLAAFDNLIELTLAEKADILVLAGDIYDDADFEVRAQLRMRNAMKRLVDAGVRVMIVHGNHDPLVKDLRLAAALPPEVTVFTPGDPQVHTVALAFGHSVDVAGVSFGKQHELENLAQRFHTLPTDPRRTIAVLHTNVGSQSLHGDYAPCTVEDLALAPVGYWALGHIHDRRVESLGPGRWWAYPGNLQGRSAKATECGPKGALVVPILTDGFGEPEFRACDTLRFLRADIDVSDTIDLGEVNDLITARLAEFATEAEGRHLLVRIRLIGATRAHHILTRTPDLSALTQSTITAAGASITKVEVATRAPIDRQQLLQRKDLLADLLVALDQIPPSADDLLAHLGEEITGRSLQALRTHLSADPALAADLLERAERLMIDLLEESS